LELEAWNFSPTGTACKNKPDEATWFEFWNLEFICDLDFGTWNFSPTDTACKNKPDEATWFEFWNLEFICDLDFGTWNFSPTGKACKNKPDEVQPRPNTVFALSPFRPFALSPFSGFWILELGILVRQAQPVKINRTKLRGLSFGTWNLFVIWIWNLEF
jgi:hypothetical protein